MGGDSLEVVTDLAPCGSFFAPGESYLVFGRPTDEGRLIAGMCGKTTPLRSAGDELDFLRQRLEGDSTTFVFGRVREQRYLPKERRWHGFPASGLKITLVGEEEAYETTTDSDGAYRFEDVPAGAYRIAAVGTGFVVASPPAPTVQLRSGGCVERDVTVRTPRGRIHGRLLDAGGDGAAGVRVEVTFAGPEQLAGDAVITDGRGRFEVDNLEPGSYRLSVNTLQPPSAARGPSAKWQIGASPYPTQYYPGVGDAAGALLVEVPEGGSAVVEWRLPPRLAERAIAGRVVSADGTPVAGVRVALYTDTELWADHIDLGSAVETDERGEFSVIGLRGLDYEIRASLASRDATQGEARRRLTPEEDFVTLTLTPRGAK